MRFIWSFKKKKRNTGLPPLFTNAVLYHQVVDSAASFSTLGLCDLRLSRSLNRVCPQGCCQHPCGHGWSCQTPSLRTPPGDVTQNPAQEEAPCLLSPPPSLSRASPKSHHQPQGCSYQAQQTHVFNKHRQHRYGFFFFFSKTYFIFPLLLYKYV